MKKYYSTARRSGWLTLRSKRVLSLLAVAVVVFVLLYVLVPRALQALASIVMMPVVSVQSWLTDSPSGLASQFRERKELTEEITQLEYQLAEVSGAANIIKHLRQENSVLRALVGASTSPRIAATVLWRPPLLPYDVVTLDRGRTSGVVERAPVFDPTNSLVGYVSYVTGQSAQVTLLSNPSEALTVFVLGPNVYVPARGIGGGMIEVDVPQGIQVDPGNLVVVPQVDGALLGQIVRVESEPTSPAQSAFVPLSTPIQSLLWVSVGRESVVQQDFSAVHEVTRSLLEKELQLIVPTSNEFYATTSATTTIGTATSTP